MDESLSGPLFDLLLGVALNGACVWAALRLATDKGRSPKPWMWAAGLLGILPLVALLVLPSARPGASANRPTFTT